MVLRRLREGVPLPTAVISVEWEGVVVLVVGGVVEDPLPDGNDRDE